MEANKRKVPPCHRRLSPRCHQYADQNRHVDALNAWRNATMLKPEHSLAWNNMVILLDNTGTTPNVRPPFIVFTSEKSLQCQLDIEPKASHLDMY